VGNVDRNLNQKQLKFEYSERDQLETMTATLTPELEALQASLEAQGVKYALASYVDIHGMGKAKMVPIAHLNQMMQGSELFTGAALDGVPQDISDEEVAAMPDPSSATVLPWNSEVVWFASDLYLKGKPFEACCRTILKQMLAKAAEMGFTFNLGIETEFFIFKENSDGSFAPVSDRDTLAKPCYDLPSLLDNYPWVTEIVEYMNRLGWMFTPLTMRTPTASSRRISTTQMPW